MAGSAMKEEERANAAKVRYIYVTCCNCQFFVLV